MATGILGDQVKTSVDVFVASLTLQQKTFQDLAIRQLLFEQTYNPVENWLGQSGLQNYIINGQFNLNVSGINLYNDGPVPTPVDGTGLSGPAIATITWNGTNTLFGSGDAIFAKPTETIVTSVGQGISTDFTVDQGLEGQTLQLYFYYRTGGNYVSSCIGVYLFDRVNNSFIPMSSVNVQANFNSTLFNAYGTLNANSTLYRLIFHIQTENFLPWSFEFDNVTLSPIGVNTGAAIVLSTARLIGVQGDITGTPASFNGSENVNITNILIETIQGVSVHQDVVLPVGTTQLNIEANLYATEFFGPLSGNATTATSATSANISNEAIQLQTARQIGITGDVTSSNPAVFDGTADTNISSTLIETIQGVSIHQDNINPVGTTRLNIESNFYATQFFGPLSGNASTATTLQTSRTIAIGGDVVGTATFFNGSANISIPSKINTIQTVSVHQDNVDPVGTTRLNIEANLYATEFVGSLNGTATGWSSPTTLQLSGVISGSVSIQNGGATATITTSYPWPNTSLVYSTSSDYTVLLNDGYQFIEVTTGSNTIAIILPALSDSTGRKITVIKVDSGSGAILLNTNGIDQFGSPLTTFISIIGQATFYTIYAGAQYWWII